VTLDQDESGIRRSNGQINFARNRDSSITGTSTVLRSRRHNFPPPALARTLQFDDCWLL